MSIIDTEKYYYFKIRNNYPYNIKVSLIQINTAINRNYVEMSENQKEFYIEHPDASVQEIWNCKITPPYVPPTPDIQEYIVQKVKELKDACYASITVDELQYAMAMDKMQNITGDSYYSITEARNVLSNFRSQSKHAMQVYETYKPQIEACLTIETIDTLYNQAIEAL